MGEYLKCECSHCGQPIEYPSEGTGQTVPCPACNGSVVLTPSEPPAPKILVPPVVPPPAPAVTVPKSTNPPLPDLAPSQPPVPKVMVPPVVPPAPAPAVTVPKPTNPPPPELKSSEPPVPKVLVPTNPPPAKVPTVRVSMSKLPPSLVAGRFEQAWLEFERDAEFEKNPPTREQIARAWALAEFRRSNPSEWPTHLELVVALRELFREFRSPRSGSSRSHSSKPG